MIDEANQMLAGLLESVCDRDTLRGLLEIVISPLELSGTLSEQRDARDAAIRADPTLGPAIIAALEARQRAAIASWRARQATAKLLPFPPVAAARPPVTAETRHAA